MRAIGKFIWRFMVIFSFIVNIILVVVLLVLGLLIFDIKNNIAQPLVAGLHSSFVGLDQATIDWTIPVRDRIGLDLNIPLSTRTTVVLARQVPLKVDATINLNGQIVPVDVSLVLPEGTELDVFLDLNVPVKETVPVSLDVRAVIPLQETQLHDVAENLRLLFEPLARALYNLPGDFNEAGELVGDVLRGNPPNLLVDNDYSLNPWPGYSRTAGLNYQLAGQAFPPCNVPVETGIVPIGGIPALDEQLRPELYLNGSTPASVNAQAVARLGAQTAQAAQNCLFSQSQAAVPSAIGGPVSVVIPGETADDIGIISTPIAPTGSGG